MSDLDPRYQGLAGLSPAPSGKSRSVGHFVLHLIFTLPLLGFGLFGSSALKPAAFILVLSGLAYLSTEARRVRWTAWIGLLFSALCVYAVVRSFGDRHGLGFIFGALSLPVFLATGLAWLHVLNHRGTGNRL